jgi:hypothetical protein
VRTLLGFCGLRKPILRSHVSYRFHRFAMFRGPKTYPARQHAS